MKVTKSFKYAVAALVFASFTGVSCKSDDDGVPEEENDLEVITDIELIFTNKNDSTDVVEALAKDPDGPGIKSLEIKEAVNLKKDQEYELTFKILNSNAEEKDEHDDEDGHDEDGDDHKEDGDEHDHDKEDGDEHDHDDEDGDDHKEEGDGHDHEHGFYVHEEIKGEDDEHQLFFGFDEGAFANPAGNGNIDNASDAIQYLDKDENGLPLGLETLWKTADKELTKGKFTVYLKHQPDGVKTATSTSNDGESDFELTFELNIQ